VKPKVISAIPTAFEPDGGLDLAGTRRIMEHAMSGGVDALFIAGTTAEFPALSASEVVALFEAAVDVAGAERVIAHVGAVSAYQARSLTRHAIDLGVGAIAAITPYYMASGTSAVTDYFASIREASNGTALFAYFFPDRTGIHLDVEEVVELASNVQLDGLKLSGLDIEFVGRAVTLLPGTPVFSGADDSYAEVVALGAAGVVSGVSSAFPDPFARMTEALVRGDRDAQREAQNAIDTVVPVVGPSLRALKVALARLGVIDSPTCRVAIDQVAPEIDAQISAVIAQTVAGSTT